MKQQVDLNDTLSYKINPDLYRSIFKDDGKGDPNKDEYGKPFFTINPVNIPKTIQSMVKALQQTSEKERAAIMTEMGESMPALQQMVSQEMNAGGGGQGPQNKAGKGGPFPLLPTPGGVKGVDMRAQPSQKPPRRAGSV
jgi:hypothetical protein